MENPRMFSRTSLVAGLAIALLTWSPVSARGDSKEAIAGGAATALLMGMVCWALTSAGDDDPEAEDAFDREGWLVGLRGGFALQTFEDQAEDEVRRKFPSAQVSVDDSYEISGNAGYRCHSRASTDVRVGWVEGFEQDASATGFADVTADMESVVVTANTKVYLLTGRFQPFLLVGGGGMTVRELVKANIKPGQSPIGLPVPPVESLTVRGRKAGFVTRFGGGVDVYATKNLVVNLGVDYVLPLGSLEDLDFLSIGGGLEYRF